MTEQGSQTTCFFLSFLFLFLLFSFPFFFLGPQVHHMETPRLGAESELQLLGELLWWLSGLRIQLVTMRMRIRPLA